MDWTLGSVNDSITEVKVGIKSNEHSTINRLGVLTGETDFTRSLKKQLKGFGKGVNKFAKNFKIQIEGISQIPPLEYLYASSKSNRIGKASMMLRLNSDLYPKIVDNEVEKNGHPFVKITAWDTSTDIIKFNFGFPIKYKDSLPISSVIKHDKSPAQKALKAIFYGNYRNSDQAWFVLMEYAKRRSISIKKTLRNIL